MSLVSELQDALRRLRALREGLKRLLADDAQFPRKSEGESH